MCDKPFPNSQYKTRSTYIFNVIDALANLNAKMEMLHNSYIPKQKLKLYKGEGCVIKFNERMILPTQMINS